MKKLKQICNTIESILEKVFYFKKTLYLTAEFKLKKHTLKKFRKAYFVIFYSSGQNTTD